MTDLDINKYKKEKLPIRITEDGIKDEMSFFEFSRWLSLLDAVTLVGKKASQIKMPKDSNKWIKPIAFQKYVNEQHLNILHEITK